MPDTILSVKQQWLALDAENDKWGKIRLLRSLDPCGPEMAALCSLIAGLHFTQSPYRSAVQFERVKVAESEVRA